MKHNYIQSVETLNSSAHYAVGTNGVGDVLIQLDDGTNQVHVKLDWEEVRNLRNLLFDAYFTSMNEAFSNRSK